MPLLACHHSTPWCVTNCVPSSSEITLNFMQSKCNNLDREPLKWLAWCCLYPCGSRAKLLEICKLKLVSDILCVDFTCCKFTFTHNIIVGKQNLPLFSLYFDRTSWCLHLNPMLLPEKPKCTSHARMPPTTMSGDSRNKSKHLQPICTAQFKKQHCDSKHVSNSHCAHSAHKW